MTRLDRRTLIAALPMAAAPAAAQENASMADALDPRIVKLFKDLEAVWASRDFARMRGFWVKDLAAPLYLPEEKKDFMTTWAEFDAYFKGNTQGTRAGLVKVAPQFAMPMGPGLQMVAFALEWTLQLVNEAKPIGGSVRGVALVEDAGPEVKLKAYIEAPLAPIMYIRELYETVAVSRGFKPVP
jgi:hypothetical protein